MSEMNLKVCTKCNKSKSLDSFHDNKNYKDGKMYICSLCRSEYKKSYYIRTKEYQRVVSKQYYHNHLRRAKSYSLKTRLGITIEDKENLLIKQNYLCLGCNMKLDINKSKVDHDHKTGIIRGILCTNCNIVLGHAHDNTKVLENLINYLKKG